MFGCIFVFSKRCESSAAIKRWLLLESLLWVHQWTRINWRTLFFFQNSATSGSLRISNMKTCMIRSEVPSLSHRFSWLCFSTFERIQRDVNVTYMKKKMKSVLSNTPQVGSTDVKILSSATIRLLRKTNGALLTSKVISKQKVYSKQPLLRKSYS